MPVKLKKSFELPGIQKPDFLKLASCLCNMKLFFPLVKSNTPIFNTIDGSWVINWWRTRCDILRRHERKKKYISISAIDDDSVLRFSWIYGVRIKMSFAITTYTDIIEKSNQQRFVDSSTSTSPLEWNVVNSHQKLKSDPLPTKAFFLSRRIYIIERVNIH